MTDQEFRETVTAFLAQGRTATLATMGIVKREHESAVMPCACNVFYVSQALSVQGSGGRGGNDKKNGASNKVECEGGRGRKCVGGWRLYWVSSPESQHSLNVGRDGLAAMTVYGDEESPSRLHGVQMRGRVAMVEPGSAKWGEAWALYSAKYPFVQTGPMRERVEAERFYRFEPTWLRWVDNRVHFGFKQEMDLVGG